MALAKLGKKKKADAPKKYAIKKGDTVVIITGKDKGKTGTVRRVLRDRGRVIVEGLNMVKKAVKPNPMLGERGGLIPVEAPIQVSNVMIYDTKANKASRTCKETIETPKGQKRVRVAVKTKTQLDD